MIRIIICSDMLSRLKGIETPIISVFRNISNSSDMLSRLKGIETLLPTL